MTINRGTGASRGVGAPTLVSDPKQFGTSCTGFHGRGRRSARSVDPNEIDRLYRSLGEVTPENHPRTAKLLASSTRKVAQKVFEEAGEVALEAVRHNARGIVRESADLLYNLAALWHRTGVRPDDVWAEMRGRAVELGIAEKLPKDRDTRAPAGGEKHTGGDDEPHA
jgi:phosphoribosyl-ATP pyrophosphohydrolase